MVKHQKGKTYEELYGKEKANKIKAKIGKKFKGKTYEERFGKEKAKEMKLQRSKLKKGKKLGTYEEIYGKEKAKEMKLNQSKKMKRRKYGTLEERFGKEKAKEIKLEASKKRKGISYEERFGKEKAKKMRVKLKLSYEEKYGKERAEEIKLKKGKGMTYKERFGKERAKKIGRKISKRTKGKTYEEIYGKEKAKEIGKKIANIKKKWTKNVIINNLTNLLETIGPFKRSDINILSKYYNICTSQTMTDVFGSLDNLAIEAGIEFKLRKDRCSIGKNEKQILDEIEQEKGITLLRQYHIAGKFIDGYDKKNNVAYEVDEIRHKYYKVEDAIRENKIREVLGCEFVRIPDF